MAEAKEKTKVEVVPVTMTDGRVVEFAGKRQMVKEYFTENGEVSARFDFRNGETRSITLSPQLVFQSAGHGLVQKVGDSTAGIPKIEDMVLAVEETIKQLTEGNWNVKREGSGGFSGAGVVLRAMCEHTGKSLDEVKAFVEKKIADTGATRQAIYQSLRLSEKLKPIIARLEAESASKESKIDADAALAELES